MSMYSADGKFIGAKCDMNKCMNMSKEECAKYCDSVGCSAEEKAMCVQHAGATMGAKKDCCKKGGMEEKKACCKEGAAAGKACSGEAAKKACMDGCTHGCQTKEECAKKCGDICVKKH